ncbi:hypothetical protein GCM10025866_33570 [Naasia aerilata]|uniref:Uncharacterized protein n=1 Tax=Naasia aerilata TaxID=1162966 RepID=A0ABN6XTI1_9MICO|nr:hypothetical protein GCM10025866_33570 [Naasia aerilata]
MGDARMRRSLRTSTYAGTGSDSGSTSRRGAEYHLTHHWVWGVHGAAFLGVGAAAPFPLGRDRDGRSGARVEYSGFPSGPWELGRNRGRELERGEHWRPLTVDTPRTQQ